MSSLFFAYKHFKVPDCVWDKLPGGGSATWDMGFFVAWYDTVGIAYEFGFARFGGLFMFGAFLCLLYIRTKSLWPCVGFLGGAGMTDGWLALAVLTAMCAALLLPSGRSSESNGARAS